MTHIKLATEEDKSYQLDYWARLFKATTWEERIHMEYEAREDYYRTQRGIQNMLDSSAAKIKDLTAENEAL